MKDFYMGEGEKSAPFQLQLSALAVWFGPYCCVVKLFCVPSLETLVL